MMKTKIEESEPTNDSRAAGGRLHPVCSASFDPQTIGDWLLPFRREDNTAWQKANLLGRIFFPAYLLMAAWRTLMFWAFMLALLPVGVIVGISESEASQAFGAWIERIFVAAFCKQNDQALRARSDS